jgi:glycosyltransferase involved in cell wall biosynthesis
VSNNEPLISIITVVYNGVKTIEQTINSVIQQQYKNFEYIVIDGGSDDGTVSIIKKYEKHITYWVSEKDKGIYNAMNKGIRQAKGEIIGIINSDDWYEENAFEMVAGYYKTLTDKTNVILHGLMRVIKNEQVFSVIGNSAAFLHQIMIQHPTCFVPKKMYDTIGNYDEVLSSAADYDFMLRAVKNNVRFIIIENVIANFRIDGTSFKYKSLKESLELRYKYKLISRNEKFIKMFVSYFEVLLKHKFRK